MDKWFILQATSPSSDTLNNVFKLMKHKAFSLENPNKVRSLIGSFCSANLLQFHQDSGEGYAFLADQVIALNKINPQVASRMVSLFNTWRKFNKSSRKLIEKHLKRIHKTEDLSPDVFEIVDKALS